MEKKFDFVVSTSNTCFICFNPAINLGNLTETFSLKGICQHLKIKLSEAVTVPTRLIHVLSKSNIKVSLCGECSDLTQQLSNLHEEMEVIKLKMEFNFKQLQSKMKGVGEDGKEDYQRKLEVDPQALLHSEIVEKLRTEIIAKCEPIVEKIFPKIEVKRMKYTPPPPPLPPDNPNLIALLSLSAYQPASADLQDSTSYPVKEEALEIDLCSSEDENQDEAPITTQNYNLITSDPLDLPSTTAPIQSSSSEVYQCKLCEACSTSRQGLTNHISRAHPDPSRPVKVTGTFKCELCSHVSTTKAGLGNHITKSHPEAQTKYRNFVCNICGKRFFMKNHLKLHKNLHLGVKFYCPKCGKDFNQKAALNQHLKFCNAEPEAKKVGFECDICQTQFAKSNQLKIHKSTHFEVKFECAMCGIAFGEQEELKFHVRNYCKPAREAERLELEREFECNICQERFREKDQLINHKNIHLNEKCNCPWCGQEFFQKGKLNLHMERFCKGVVASSQGQSTPEMAPVSSVCDQIVCKHCGIQFDTVVSLNIHVGVYHSQEDSQQKRFPCQICKTSFASMPNLNMHMNTHLGKKYQCGFCPLVKSQPGPIYLHQTSGKCPGYNGNVYGRPRTILIEANPIQGQSGESGGETMTLNFVQDESQQQVPDMEIMFPDIK